MRREESHPPVFLALTASISASLVASSRPSRASRISIKSSGSVRESVSSTGLP